MSIEQWLPGSVGVLLCVWVAVWFARLGFRAVGARSWPAVQGHVVSCVIERGRRMSARARIRYEYQVEGQTLSGDTLFFGDFFDANQAIAEERAQAYPVGRKVVVRHHPTRLSVSCLEPRADLRVWLFLGTALVMASVILRAIAVGE